jgi:tight adherence protein C
VTLLFPVLAFGFGFGLVVAAVFVFWPNPAVAIDRRLVEVTGRLEQPRAAAPRLEHTVNALKNLGSRLPASPKEMGKLRLRLVNGGFRRDEALLIFLGIRAVVALLAFLALATPVFGRPNVMMGFAGLGFGYIVPGILLGKIAKRRQHRIRLALADALDLLVVSVEAGLGLDQALSRVGEELSGPYPDLSDEIRLVGLELRAGKGRSEALRNLADRTGVDDLSALVTMLIQTDKFGTSVAQSLRVYSDTLRTKRRQRAEEAAAKTGVKMVFPLVFCIFPAIWVVTIGPAAIKFVQVLFPITSGNR